MNHILTYGLAVTFATMLTPPVFAEKGGRGGGGGGGARGAAPAHVSAPAAPHFSAPRMSVAHAPTMHAPFTPHIVSQAPQFRSAPTIHSRPITTFTPSVAQRNVIRGQHNAPTVAFGGTVNNNAALNVQNARNNFAANNQSRTFAGGNARDFRVPRDTSREWDHRRDHEWHHHHFRFFNGDWVIIDPGYPYYDYGYYGNDYGAPVPYSDYTYNSTSPGSLVAGAQDRLTRLGYSPGAVDGVLGAQTRDAIATFQNDNNIPATGYLDTATVRALGL